MLAKGTESSNANIALTGVFMKIENKVLKFKTEKPMQFVDLTDEAKEFVRNSQIQNGVLTVYSKHTTMAIRVNESERGIRHDLRDLLNRLIPKDTYYQHNDLFIRTENLVCDKDASDCINAHSHLIHFLMGNSESIPIIENTLSLGQWQRIFALELDCSRNREVILQLVGE